MPTNNRAIQNSIRLPFPGVLDVFYSAIGATVGDPVSLTSPEGCLTLIMGCVVYMRSATPDRSQALLNGMRKAMFAFILRPISEDHIRDLHACVCSARHWALALHDIQDLHSLGEHAIQEHSRGSSHSLLLSAMSGELLTAIDSTTQKRRVLRVGSKLEQAAIQNQALPSYASPSDILPFDVTTCLHTLLEERMSGDALEARTVLPLVSSIICACVSEGIPAIISSSTFVPTLETMVRSFTQEYLRTSTHAVRDEYLYVLERVAKLFIHLSDVSLSNIEYIACITANNDKSFVRMCDVIIRTWEGSHKIDLTATQRQKLRRLAGQFTSLGAHFFRWTNVPANEWRFHHALTDHASKCSRVDVFPPVVASRNCQRMVKSERCFAPACLNTHTSMGRKFARCARCMRVPFCSKECQQAAWDDPVAPHKQLCHALLAFSRLARIPKHAGSDYCHSAALSKEIPMDVINDVVCNTERLFEQQLVAMASLPQFGERLSEWINGHLQYMFSGTRLDIKITRVVDDRWDVDCGTTLAES